MGGTGSGRRSGNRCADDMRSLDVRRLQREGRLKPGSYCLWQWTRNGEQVASVGLTVEPDRLWLNYRQRQNGGDWQDFRYAVGLARTACRYGGERVWWRCPATGCGRRVALLYGGAVFACRHCHRLAYRSQRETAGDRAIRRADKLRARLGWEAGILNLPGGRPKGMQRQTYERLWSMYDKHNTTALTSLMAQIGVVRNRLDAINAGMNRVGRDAFG